MRDDETDTPEETTVTEATPDPTTDPTVHELWEWLDQEARDALLAGGAPTDEQLDAAADRRRATEPKADAQVATVHHLPGTPGAGRLAVNESQTWWTQAQRAALDSIGHANTPDGDLVAFLHLAQRTGLDPFARELYLIGRRDRQAPTGTKWTAQTGIDGFRHIAERTGLYGGVVKTEWCGPDAQWVDVWLSEDPPSAARVTVRRLDRDDPEVATALYREFVPLKDEYQNDRKTGRQVPAAMWAKMPAHMLAKCAEALAIRKAFPRQAAGIYSDDEMGTADQAIANEDREKAAAAAREARQALVSRPWADAPTQGTASRSDVTLADVAPGQVIEGVLVDEEGQIDREALMAELEEQARLHATTVPAMTRRWAVANRKNLEDASDAELAAIVRERRASTAERVVAEVAASTEVPRTDPVPAEDEIRPQEGQDGPQDDAPAAPGPEVPDDPEARERRREEVEERAREVARQDRQAKKRAESARTRGETPPAEPEQGTLA